MAIQDVMRVAVLGVVHGQTTINTFYYEQTAGAGVEGEGQASNLANAILAATWWGAYIDLHSNEWSATKFQIAKVARTPPAVQLSPTYEVDIVDDVGDYVGGSLPTSIALVVKRKTDFGGRRGRGRIFLTGVPSDWEDDSRIDTADVNFSGAMTSLLSNLNATLTNATIEWQPRHYMPSHPTVLVGPIRVWQYDSVLRNQRRRQVGVGI